MTAETLVRTKWTRFQRLGTGFLPEIWSEQVLYCVCVRVLAANRIPFNHFFFQKITPSTSYKGSSVNDKENGKWEAPVNRGLLSRLKNIFSHSSSSGNNHKNGRSGCEQEEEAEDNTRGNEWLLEGESDANLIRLRSDSSDDIGAFGEEKCNSITEVPF